MSGGDDEELEQDALPARRREDEDEHDDALHEAMRGAAPPAPPRAAPPSRREGRERERDGEEEDSLEPDDAQHTAEHDRGDEDEDDDDRPHTAEDDLDRDDGDEDLPDAFDGGDSEERPVALADEFAQEAGVATQDAALGCIRCGNSCRSVYLWQGDLALFKERDTKKWVEYHDLVTFTAKQTDGRTFWGVKLDKPCRYLITTDDGLHGCAIYDRRPYLCRIYKGVNPDGPQQGCGFNREGPRVR